MAIGKYSLVLMILIGIVYETTGKKCHLYPKHTALRKGLLSDRAICKAKDECFDMPICLNGETPKWAYCSTGSCNIFGYNCDGHCLSGDDLNGEKNLDCDVSIEIRKLCDFYYYYDPKFIFDHPNLEKLCPTLKDDCLKRPMSKKFVYDC